jgi:hypothetical protein
MTQLTELTDQRRTVASVSSVTRSRQTRDPRQAARKTVLGPRIIVVQAGLAHDEGTRTLDRPVRPAASVTRRKQKGRFADGSSRRRTRLLLVCRPLSASASLPA